MINERLIATVVTTALAALAFPGVAGAKKFRADMEGFANPTYLDACNIVNEPSAEGHALHMGRVTMAASEVVNVCVPPGEPVLAVGDFVLTASNGDTVLGQFDVAVYQDFETFTAEANGPYVLVGGTGRFAGATGAGHWNVFFPSLDPASTAPAQVTVSGTIFY